MQSLIRHLNIFPPFLCGVIYNGVPACNYCASLQNNTGGAGVAGKKKRASVIGTQNRGALLQLLLFVWLSCIWLCCHLSRRLKRWKRRGDVYVSETKLKPCVMTRRAELARREERGYGRMWRHHHSGTDRNPAQTHTYTHTHTHTHTHTLHAASEVKSESQMGELYRAEWSTAHKQNLSRGIVRFARCSGPLTCALGDWRPWCAAIVLSAGQIFEDTNTSTGIWSVCRFQGQRTITRLECRICNER